ncbi:intermediate conductance calcium-activated potassium channel protein 4 [Amia ocellicauda]|uniref:intermediate conductance calcium-activated potassium channel protein 4 n=1 Tax=Amia ocellicauda TaxID=2972642 RepID=UPI0034644982
MPSHSRGNGLVGGKDGALGNGAEDADEEEGEDERYRGRGGPGTHRGDMELTEKSLLPASKTEDQSDGRDCTEITVSGSPRTPRPGSPHSLFFKKLVDRKLLQGDKKRLCAWALGAATLGILLMVLHAEMCPVVYTANMIPAFIMKCLISLSTVCLIFLIVVFHYKDIQVFMIDHNLEDWRIAITMPRVLGIILEIAVCAVHPFATGWGPQEPWDKGAGANTGKGNFSSPPLCSSSGPADALSELELLLSCMMFLRLYLVHRAMLLHSKVLLSASYRSIGSLNNINFSFRFMLKVLMNTYPARSLLCFILMLWLCASWMLTLCERQTREETGRMDNAMWLIAITFLTVGYGDLYPKTSCGKTVCLFTGVMGVGCTAMLVAVLTKKLALNKGEKHVHHFMLDIQITKEVRVAAANVLRACWLLHRSDRAKRGGEDSRGRQRQLLEAIRVFRYARLKQRKLRDNASEIVDPSMLQVMLYDLSSNWSKSYKDLEQRIVTMETKLDNLARAFQDTSALLTRIAQQPRSLDNSFP